MKWELHTYYDKYNGEKKHTLKDPFVLYTSCSACHHSFNGMDNEWKDFLFCPHCGQRVEGIDETSKLWSDVVKKYI